MQESDISDGKRDYYAVLGVARDADQKAIREAFRELALRYHPDRNKEPEAEERFKEIAEAYAVLSDSKKRAEYDHRGFEAVSDFSEEDLFGGIDFDDIFGAGLFGDFFRRRHGPPRGADIEVDLAVSLERVANGGEETVTVNRPALCPDCHGSGAEAGSKPRLCERCNGSGQVRITRTGRAGDVVIQQISSCPVCHGQGRLIEKLCSRCGGRGRIELTDSLKVSIPRALDDGMSLRIQGRGMPSADPRGPAGDLFVVVRTKHDPRFERSGSKLWRTETISVVDAVLGVNLTIPTLENHASVSVPPGTQPDSVLRLRGKGLPDYATGDAGDLYLRLKVRIPGPLSPEARALYERLRSLGS